MVPGVCCPLSRPLPRSSIMSSQIHRDYLPLGSMQWSASRDKCKESVFSSLVCYGNRSRLDMRAQCIRDSGSDDARTSVSTDEGKETARQSSRENINGHVKTTDESLSAAMVEVAEKVVEAAAQKVSTVGEIEALSTEALVLDQPTAIKTVVFWVTAAVAFGAFVGITEGSTKASEFFAGYLLEQSLSVDNLFVFVLIFKYFQVPVPYQGRVLAYGIAGAIVFRATMILLGIATVQRFEAVNLLFAGVLLFSSYKLLSESEDDEVDLSSNYVVNACKRYIPVSSDYDGNNFFTVVDGAKKATPLLLTLAVIELSDIAFAVDSIPAVFGVTRDPFIVLSSNLFAILGLRSLYTLISSSMAELEYLQPSVAIILGFIGGKMVLDFFGFHVPTEASFIIVAATLGTGVSLSLLLPSSDDESKRD